MKIQLPSPLPSSTICARCRLKSSINPKQHRYLATTASNSADSPSPPNTGSPSPMRSMADIMYGETLRQAASPPSSRSPSSIADFAGLDAHTPPSSSKKLPPRLPDPHHLHIYAHKHNTHITLTRPNRNPIISVSTGNLNFRKAQRGTYDAAYQLGKYVMERIQQQGLLKEIQSLEVVMRDFGPGREALTKVLLGSEGRGLRGRVVRVADASRVKFGGTRGEKPRRLG
jgi:small subunit ribosomal protein S11